jgi:hypothetical protein
LTKESCDNADVTKHEQAKRTHNYRKVHANTGNLANQSLQAIPTTGPKIREAFLRGAGLHLFFRGLLKGWQNSDIPFG